MKTTCIMCPIGCQLEITNVGDQIQVLGNLCPRGKQYGVDEATCPKRIVTSIVKCSKDLYCSVKTTCPVEKTKIDDVLHEIALIPPKKYKFGEILIKNVAGTKADIVVTGV
ncbi:MAG: DUF1667 domain-containing protein [Christensenellales bacterium]